VGQRDLPLASGADHVKAFVRAGWVCSNKRAKDAHFYLSKAGERHCLSIPAHHQVKRALLQKQIKLAGLSEREYCDHFHKQR